MAFVKNGKVIRRCKMCGITNDTIAFFTQKCSRNGKRYTHNICRPCRREYNYSVKYKNISREEHSRRASEWNMNNRKKYNARRRVKSWLFNGCIDNFYTTEVL